MNCPTCGAWTSVLETRDSDGTVRRRRQCANLHRFTTVEVRDSLAAMREVSRNKTLIRTARRIWARNQQIIADPRPSPEVARAYNLSAPMVRQIRRQSITGKKT